MPRSSSVRAVLVAIIVAGLVSACATAPDSSPGTGGEPTAVPGGAQEPAVTPVGEAGTDEDVPAYLACDPNTLPFALPPDAKRCQHVDIITNYFTTASTEDAIKFHADNLEQAGWQRTDDGALSGIGRWLKGSAQLNVIAGPQEGMTAVQIQEVAAP